MEILRVKGILLDLMMDLKVGKEDKESVEKLCRAAVQMDIFWSVVNKDCELVFENKNNIDNCKVISKCLQIEEKLALGENLKGGLETKQDIEDYVF